MFDWFKKSVESTKNTKEAVTPCYCDGNNEHCDLILQLREHQRNKKDIEKTIAELNKDGYELLINFIKFLKELEGSGVYMNTHNSFDRFGDNYFAERNIPYIIQTINRCTTEEIFRIAEELKTYRNKADIICDYQRSLKATEGAIEEIKTKLGIE